MDNSSAADTSPAVITTHPPAPAPAPAPAPPVSSTIIPRTTPPVAAAEDDAKNYDVEMSNVADGVGPGVSIMEALPGINKTTMESARASHESFDFAEGSAASPADGPHGKKRKREEGYELYLHATAHPHLKQRELAEWFSATFNKPINQSTVSRNLKKYKTSSPGPSRPRASPLVAQRQSPKASSRSPQPTPSRLAQPQYSDPISQLESQLSLYYYHCKRQQPEHSEPELSRNLKTEAQRILAALGSASGDTLPLPTVDDTWIENWKRRHRTSPPSPSPSTSSSTSTPITLPPLQNFNRDTDINSPLPSLTKATAPTSGDSADGLGNALVSPISQMEEKTRKKEIKKLRKDIEKRERQIQKAAAKKDESQRRLDELIHEEQMEQQQQHAAGLEMP